MTPVAATVGDAVVLVSDVNAHEERLRSTPVASALPRAGTSEGRQLRRWLVQVLVTARVVSFETRARGLTGDGAPSEAELLPDVTARLELGSIAASALEDAPGRALFAHVTAGVEVSADDVAEYHRRNPFRFGTRAPGNGGWLGAPAATSLDDVRMDVHAHLLASARRREFRRRLDERRARLVRLSPGYEHPGDPRQPDYRHQH